MVAQSYGGGDVTHIGPDVSLRKFHLGVLILDIL